MENTDHLCSLRAFELERALSSFPSLDKTKEKCPVLEIGAGMGAQARLLSKRGYDVLALDVPTSAYRDQRVYPVVEFDGHTLPVDNGGIEVVFSSNVLEHIRDIDALLDEIDRVVTPGGYSIHILPTPCWRFWTLLGHYAWMAKKLLSILNRSDALGGGEGQSLSMWDRFFANLFPLRHGERGTAITELFYFSQYWWTRKFEAHGWRASACYSTGLFYTGACVFGDLLPIFLRQRLSRWLGSSCRVYVLRRMRPG